MFLVNIVKDKNCGNRFCLIVIHVCKFVFCMWLCLWCLWKEKTVCNGVVFYCLACSKIACFEFGKEIYPSVTSFLKLLSFVQFRQQVCIKLLCLLAVSMCQTALFASSKCVSNCFVKYKQQVCTKLLCLEATSVYHTPLFTSNKCVPNNSVYKQQVCSKHFCLLATSV